MLNAFRHLRNCHPRGKGHQVTLQKCSTPFGIYGIVTSPLVAPPIAMLRCSTPFGIYGIVTTDLCRIAQLWSSAQRLSASTELSPGSVGFEESLLKVLNAFRHLRNCHGLSGELAKAVSLVLNAFRHLRNCHRHGHNRPAMVPVVLNAFRHLRNCHNRCPGRFRTHRCAQRLSASTELSPPARSTRWQ